MIDIFGHTWKNIRTTEHFFFLAGGTILSSYLETLSLQWSWDSGQAEPELSVGGPGGRLGAVRQLLGLPWCLRQERICLQCRRPGFDPWVEKIPWRRAWLPAPVFLAGEFHGQRNLADYSPWSQTTGHD